jgi:hypothetical protein
MKRSTRKKFRSWNNLSIFKMERHYRMKNFVNSIYYDKNGETLLGIRGNLFDLCMRKNHGGNSFKRVSLVRVFQRVN